MSKDYPTVAEIKTKRTKAALFWLVGALLLAGSVWAVVTLAQHSSPAASSSGSIPQVTSADHIQGNPGAKIVLVEYADYQCPFCKSAAPMVNQLLTDYPNQIEFVYRNFPLKTIHATAELAVSAAEAAGRQGKFWQMHDLLYANQDAWANQPTADQIFTSYAQQLGLNLDSFKQNLSDLSKPEADYNQALRLHLDHTPTFFLNGKEVATPANYQGFKDLINAQLQQ